MKEKTAMSEQAGFPARNRRFQNSLRSAVAHFRYGEDQAGIDALYDSLDDLECVMDLCKGADLPRLEKMLPAVRRLLACIENSDAGGLVDLLEFSILPITKEWGGGCQEK